MTVQDSISNKRVIAGCKIKVAGSDIAADLMSKLASIEVNQTVYQPAMFVIRFWDSDFKVADSSTFEVAKEIDIQLGSTNTTTSVIKGEITSIELDADYESRNYYIVRGYDKLHRLTRGRKTRTFKDVTDSDLISKIAGEAGLSAEAESTSPVYKYVIQNNESNLEFLHRRAAFIGMELFVKNNSKLVMRKPDTSTELATVKWGEDLLNFSMRVSGAGQTDEVLVRGWDPVKKEAIVGTSSSATALATAGLGKTGKQLGSSFGAAKFASDQTEAIDQANATKRAAAIMDDIGGRAYLVEGKCLGNTNLKAGGQLKIEKAGTKFSGKYYLTSCTHIYSADGYYTHFEASGKQAGRILDLVNNNTDPVNRIYGTVVGVVTNNKPAASEGAMDGSVKVKFPWMPQDNGTDIESNWARLVSPMAGNERGFYCVPEVNDEVLVAFENGDPARPYVLGALWNGKDKTPETTSNAVDGSGKVKLRTFKTRVGHILRFNDSDDAPKIEIIDKTTKNKITIDSTNNKITILADTDIDIKATNGKINIEAKMDITMKSSSGKVAVESATDMNLKAGTNGKIETSANLDVKAGANLTAEGTAQATLKGPMVDVKASGKGTIDGGGMLEVKGGMVKIN
jgi:uncharacterized protein involved in type VI secretion and phage assembly